MDYLTTFIQTLIFLVMYFLGVYVGHKYERKRQEQRIEVLEQKLAETQAVSAAANGKSKRTMWS